MRLFYRVTSNEVVGSARGIVEGTVPHTNTLIVALTPEIVFLAVWASGVTG